MGISTAKQTAVDWSMRNILIGWLIDVDARYGFSPETLYFAVDVVDRYLKTQHSSKTELQLLGITGLWMAAKFEETYVAPKMAHLVHLCDGTYSKEQVLSMEAKIVQALDFQMLSCTSFHFLEILMRYIELTIFAGF